MLFNTFNKVFAAVLVGCLVLPSSSMSLEYRFYHSDSISSNTVVTNRAGQIVQRMVHRPFGEPHAIIDGNGDALQSNADDVRNLFTDHEYDSESGLHYAGARFYDSTVGRFLSTDPGLVDGGVSFQRVGGDAQNLNTHTYAMNRPTVLFDPTGEFAQYAVPAAVCGPVCLGGALLLSAGIVYMSAPRQPTNVIPFPGRRGPRGPTPTPTPLPTPPADLPKATPTPEMGDFSQFADLVDKIERSLPAREFRNSRGQQILDFGTIDEDINDFALRIQVSAHLNRALGDVEEAMTGKALGHRPVEATLRIKPNARIRNALKTIQESDSVSRELGEDPARTIQVEQGSALDVVRIRGKFREGHY